MFDKEFVYKGAPDWAISLDGFFESTGWFLAAIGAGLIVFRWFGSPIAMVIIMLIVGNPFFFWWGLP